MTRPGDSKEPIAFHRPQVAGPEFEYIREAIASSDLSGDGAPVRRCQKLLEDALGVPRALLTTSCTHALEMAALLLDIGPGDEVVVPSFTFSSTAAAFMLRGARPVFADIRPDTCNLDESALEALLTPRTRAIVPVHYAGIGCEMDRILELASARRVPVVEDNAHGLFGSYRGRPLGSFGVLATQSFHETKNFTCGEGGALLVNDPALIERAEILREKGTDRSRFYRGEVDKYTWCDLGSSYVPSGILAAFLAAQLEARERIQAVRRRLWERYQAALADWAHENWVRLPAVPDHCEPAWHLYAIQLPTAADRTRLIAHLAERQIQAVFHYQPLHLSPVGTRLGGRPGDCPVAEEVAGRLLRLPLHNALDEADQERVCEALESYEIL